MKKKQWGLDGRTSVDVRRSRWSRNLPTDFGTC